MTNVDKVIATAVKTGKVVFGATEAERSLRSGKARLIVLASNSPPQTREDLEYYGHLSQIPVATYTGSSRDLGIVCGKPFAVAALTVKEPGDSDLEDLIDRPEQTQKNTEGNVEEL